MAAKQSQSTLYQFAIATSESLEIRTLEGSNRALPLAQSQVVVVVFLIVFAVLARAFVVVLVLAVDAFAAFFAVGAVFSPILSSSTQKA